VDFDDSAGAQKFVDSTTWNPESDGKSDLIFFDPDNGITSNLFKRNPSVKHLYWHEVATTGRWQESLRLKRA
jgi:hypothetical protein